MSRILLPLAALTLVLSACDSDPADSAELDLLPLDVGDAWTMVRTRSVLFDADGMPIDTTAGDPSRRYTMAVVRDSIIDGERWSRVEFTSDQRFASTLWSGAGAWLTHRESSLYRLAADGTAQRLYRLDVPEGETAVSNAFTDVVLDARARAVTVAAGEVTVAVFTRVDKSVEAEPFAGLPVSPRVPTAQALSASVGPVVLEVLYATRRTEAELTPLRLIRYELASGGD